MDASRNHVLHTYIFDYFLQLKLTHKLNKYETSSIREAHYTIKGTIFFLLIYERIYK
jgi:hypothetical protein